MFSSESGSFIKLSIASSNAALIFLSNFNIYTNYCVIFNLFKSNAGETTFIHKTDDRSACSKKENGKVNPARCGAPVYTSTRPPAPAASADPLQPAHFSQHLDFEGRPLREAPLSVLDVSVDVFHDLLHTPCVEGDRPASLVLQQQSSLMQLAYDSAHPMPVLPHPPADPVHEGLGGKISSAPAASPDEPVEDVGLDLLVLPHLDGGQRYH